MLTKTLPPSARTAPVIVAEACLGNDMAPQARVSELVDIRLHWGPLGGVGSSNFVGGLPLGPEAQTWYETPRHPYFL